MGVAATGNPQLPILPTTLGKFLQQPTSIPSAATSFLLSPATTSRPMVIFDASRHFSSPSPDAAFAINMSEGFLADSAQQDCTFLPTPGLSGETGLLVMAWRPNPCQLWHRQCDCSVYLGFPSCTQEGGEVRGLRSVALVLLLPRVWLSLAPGTRLVHVGFSFRSQLPSKSTACDWCFPFPRMSRSGEGG